MSPLGGSAGASAIGSAARNSKPVSLVWVKTVSAGPVGLMPFGSAYWTNDAKASTRLSNALSHFPAPRK
jgi:hypothetical protein